MNPSGSPLEIAYVGGSIRNSAAFVITVGRPPSANWLLLFIHFITNLISLSFSSFAENLLPRFASRNQNDSIAIQVSRRYTHQIISRIYSIFLREILGYRNVKLVGLYERPHEIERERLFVTLENLVS